MPKTFLKQGIWVILGESLLVKLGTAGTDPRISQRGGCTLF